MLDERQIRETIPLAYTGVDLPALGDRQSGKVRDFFQLDDRRVLITTDRLSAFDRILTAVPFKGLLQEVYCPLGTRSHILQITCGVESDTLWVTWAYSESLHRRPTIERLAEDYMQALRSLIRHCRSTKRGGYTPSDFPEAELTQEELDALVAQLGGDA